MKNLKFWSVLFLLTAGLTFYSLTNSEVQSAEISSATVSSELVTMKGPCGDTGQTQVTHVRSQFECVWRGFVWWNGKCWACH